MRRVYFSIVFTLLVLVAAMTARGQSRLNLPFNLKVPGFDTGIAVTNPGEKVGALKFILNRTLGDGTVEEFVLESADLAAGGIGTGLTPAGNLAAGGSYTVLAGELAAASGLANFSGQVTIEADFPDAQAVNFIFNNSFTAAHGYPAVDLGRTGLLPLDHLPPLIWPVKFTCGYLPEFKLGIWFTDIDILNLNEETVEVVWKAVDAGGVISSGTTELKPHGVLDIPCFEPPYNLRGKGFIKISARREKKQRLLQVVALYKNLEFSEVETQKGYWIPPVPPIPPIPPEGITPQGLLRRFVYGSEFLCGNIDPILPGSFLDLVEVIGQENLRKVWRSGVMGTNVFIANGSEQPATYSFQISDGNGRVLLNVPEQQLAPLQSRRLGCEDLTNVALPSPLKGWISIVSSTNSLMVTFDKYDYSSLVDGSLHVEYVRPMRGRILTSP